MTYDPKNPYQAFWNGAGEPIPPHGIIRLSATINDIGSHLVLTGLKPNGDLSAMYAINAGVTVPVNAPGKCLLTGFLPIKTSETSGIIGPDTASFDGVPGGMFKIIGVLRSGVAMCHRVDSTPDRHFLTPAGGIPAATRSGGVGGDIVYGVAACTPYRPTTSPRGLTLTTPTTLVYNSMPIAVAGATVINTQMESGVPVVIVEPCEGDEYGTGSGFVGSGFDSGFGSTGFTSGMDLGFGG